MYSIGGLLNEPVALYAENQSNDDFKLHSHEMMDFIYHVILSEPKSVWSVYIWNAKFFSDIGNFH